MSLPYESSAILYNVMAREKADPIIHSKDDFQCIFEKNVHPDIILKDSISLYKVTLTEAVFVDCLEDVFNYKYSFAYNAQFENATKLITMPMSSFHTISETIEMPKIPIFHLANHGRCGSTLMNKIFTAIPDTLAISELKCFSDIAVMSGTLGTNKDLVRHILHSVILSVLKHANERNSKICFIKHQSFCSYYTDLMFEVSPSIKHVYMYRQPTAFVESWEKILGVNQWWSLFNDSKLIRKIAGFGHHKLMEKCPSYSELTIESLHPYSKIALFWITGVAAFNCLVDKGFDIKSLKYEDLMEKPKETMESLFKYLDIPLSKLPDLEKVLSKDSQAGTKISTRNENKEELLKYLSPITDDLKKELDKLCDDFNVPHFWEKITLSNPV